MQTPIQRLRLAADVYAMTEPCCAALLRSAAEALGAGSSVDVFAGQAPQWQICYQVLQGAEIRPTLGAWITASKPLFGPEIAQRFASVMNSTGEDIRTQEALRADIRSRLEELLQDGTVLVMPTVPIPALKKTASHAAVGAFYEASLAINAIAGHAGLPQLVVPAGQVNGMPASLSFIAARGMDEALLTEAIKWAASLKTDGFGG